jgi:hypothetical protein
MAVDQRYYAHVPPNSLSQRLMISARDRIFSDFMSRMLPSPDDRILDVGVSDVVNDGTNVPGKIISLSGKHHRLRPE